MESKFDFDVTNILEQLEDSGISNSATLKDERLKTCYVAQDEDYEFQVCYAGYVEAEEVRNGFCVHVFYNDRIHCRIDRAHHFSDRGNYGYYLDRAFRSKKEDAHRGKDSGRHHEYRRHWFICASGEFYSYNG